MSWTLPLMPLVRRNPKDRHRPGYWREYYERNIETLRPYLAAKARQYRRKAK